MAFSMHTHSGQFCLTHAQDQLEDILKTAISKDMSHFAFTEHMPRTNDRDLYPEEAAAQYTIKDLPARHELYILEALRLREKYRGQIKVLVGFEGEWIRRSDTNFILGYAQDPRIDFFIGSVHHIHEIPIDWGLELFEKAKQSSGGIEEKLYEDYFDAQLEMLTSLQPRVVGHFDLIKLLSSDPTRDLRIWAGVWMRIVRNLKIIVEQKALLEINTSALRKGLSEPYPGRVICEEYMKLGGNFTLSDDSHGVAQVAAHFEECVQFIEGLGIHNLHALQRVEFDANSTSLNTLSMIAIPISVIKARMRITV